MTVHEIIATLPQLSFEEKLTLLEALARSLRERGGTRKYKGVSSSKLRGVLKPEAELPPDWNWKEAKAEYLAEKYEK